MVTIDIKKDKYINHVLIKGHANYANDGFDIVCASISSIVITTVNAIIRINKELISYSEEDGMVNIKILKYDEVVDKLMQNMIDLFKQLEKQYKNNVKIR